MSNGWLNRFKDHHCIKQYVIHGEAADVEVVPDAVNELLELTEAYAISDIYNCDETGVFLGCHTFSYARHSCTHRPKEHQEAHFRIVCG